MTKKGKRTASVQNHERIAELQRENQALKAAIAAGNQGVGAPRMDREPPRATTSTGSDSDAFTICDAQGTVIDVDEAALRYFGPGLRREDVIGKKLADLLPDRERCDHYLRVMETGERYTAEESVALPAGGEAQVITRAFRAGDRLAILTSDVTVQKRAEAELQAAQRTSRMILDNINEDVMVIQDGMVKLARIRPGATIRATMDDLLSSPFLEFIHPEDRQMVFDHYSRRQRGEDAPRTYESRFLDRDGSVHWIEVSATMVDWEGRPATLALLTQIDERKRAQSALTASEEKYRLLIEKTNDVIWTANLDLVLTYVSPSVEKALGFTPEEHLKRDLARQLTPESLARARDALGKHLELEQVGQADPERTLRIEMEYYRKDGSTVWMEQNVSGLRDAAGTLAGIHGVARDISRQRQAQQALEESEGKYRALAEESIQGLVLAQGVPPRILYCNSALAGMLGYTSQEIEALLPEQYAELIHPDDRKSLFKHHEDRLRGAEVEPRYQYRGVRRDGTVVWIEMASTLVQYEGAAAVQASLIDITERKAAEETLRASEERYRRLVENANDGIAVIQDGVMKYVNPRLAAVAGCTAEEMVSLSFLDFTHPDDRQMAIDHYVRRQRGEDLPSRYQFRFLRKDGTTGWAEMSADLLEWDGRTASLAMINDITERVKAEQALAESEAKYRLLVDNANQGTIVVQDEMVAFANPKLAEITGYGREELISRPFLDLIHPDDRETVKGYYSGRIKGDEVPHVYPIRLVEKEGNTRWAEINAVLIGWEGKPAVLALITDITERTKAQDALASSEAKYRDLFEHTLLGMEVIDVRTGRLVLANRSMARMFGFKSPADMVGVDSMAYVLPEDRDSVLQQMAELMNDPSWRRVATIRAATADGRLIWVTGMATPFEYEGQPAMLLSLLDATAAKEAEQKLHEREEQYRLLVDNATEAIAVLQGGRIRFGNGKFVRVSGYSPEEFLDAPSFLDFVHPEDRERVADYYVRRLTGQEVPNTYQFRFVSKAGGVGWTEVNVTLIPWEGQPATLCLMDIITERKEAEEAARRKTEELDEFFNVALDLLCIADTDGRFHLLNVAWERTLGYSREELMTGTFMDFVHPDDVRSTLGAVALLSSGSEVVGFINRYRCRDGTYRWLEWRSAPAGKMIYAAASDVTERKEAEDFLRASEEKYRLLAEKMNDVVWTMDMDLRLTYLSPSAERIFGYKPEERVGLSAESQVTPESFALATRLLQEQVDLERDPNADPQRTSRFEAEYFRKDGSTIWMEVVVSGIRDAAGSLVGVHGVSRDIDDRRRAQKALRESEQRYRLLAENATDLIWTTDAALEVTYVSPSITRLMGYNVDEIMNRPMDRLLTPTSLALMNQVHDDSLEEERAPGSMKERAVEVEMVRQDGSILWLEAAINVLRDGSGRFAGFQGACRDISGRRQAEETLRRSEDRFRTIFEKSPFGAIVYDADGNPTDINEACTVIFGLADRAAAKSVSLFDDPYLTDGAKERLRAGKSIVGEAPIDLGRAREGGQYHIGRSGMAHIRIIVTPLGREGEGTGGGYLGLVEDITERKKAEAERRHGEERLSLAMEAASAGMFDWNMITGEMHFSDRFYTMLGYDPGEFPPTYESFESLWHPDERPGMKHVIDRYRSNQTDHHEIEMRLRAKSGEWRWVASHGRMVLSWGQDIKPSRLVGAQFDITQRKEMEDQILRAHAELEARVEQRTSELKEANRLLIEEIRQRQQAQKRLQESESKYRELVENANSIIMELDTRGRVTFFNRFAEEFYGFQEPEIIGRNVVGTIAPPVDSAGKDMKALTRDLVRHPEGYFVTENEGMRRNGERVWISWTNKGLHDTEGRLRNILCIGMDRTEQRRVADMLAEQLKEKAAADERQRLARDLHDAVTQTLFSASLIAEVLPQLWRKDRGEAERRLDELRRLTRGALAEMRMLLLELRPGALGEVGLVELLRQLVEATTAQTRIRLNLGFRGKCGLPADVQVALYRVAQEALNNVVKHSGATEAGIRLSCRAGTADLTVSDNGSGFDPQAVSPRSLGLRIMHERVEAVGATLKIEGRAGGTKVKAVWSDARRKGTHDPGKTDPVDDRR